MVIVVVQILASAFIYIRDRFWSEESETLSPPRSGHTYDSDCDSGLSPAGQVAGVSLGGLFQGVTLQDALFPVLDATTLTELRTAVQTSLPKCLPLVEHTEVFLKNSTTQQIETDRATLPLCGVIRDAFHQHSRQLCSIPRHQDPVLDLLGLQSSDTRKILLLPVVSRRRDANVGIIVACLKCESLSVADEKCLDLLLKQVSVSYEAVSQAHRESFADNSHLESLIGLCGELHDQDAATLELKVIKYLREQTCAESGFLLLVVPETLELISQVVGNTILPEEVRFPGLWSCFAQALETKQPMMLEHIPLDRRGEVEKIVEKKVHSFLCVPVQRKGSDNLIALACLVNKVHGQRFGEDDIQIVRQCFKYTATVLTSTLAFQNERKLKNQTQALLHVAKKLFTRLGEWQKDMQTQNAPQHRALSVCRYFHSFRIQHPIPTAASLPSLADHQWSYHQNNNHHSDSELTRKASDLSLQESRKLAFADGSAFMSLMSAGPAAQASKEIRAARRKLVMSRFRQLSSQAVEAERQEEQNSSAGLPKTKTRTAQSSAPDKSKQPAPYDTRTPSVASVTSKGSQRPSLHSKGSGPSSSKSSVDMSAKEKEETEKERRRRHISHAIFFMYDPMSKETEEAAAELSISLDYESPLNAGLETSVSDPSVQHSTESAVPDSATDSLSSADPESSQCLCSEQGPVISEDREPRSSVDQKISPAFTAVPSANVKGKSEKSLETQKAKNDLPSEVCSDKDHIKNQTISKSILTQSKHVEDGPKEAGKKSVVFISSDLRKRSSSPEMSLRSSAVQRETWPKVRRMTCFAMAGSLRRKFSEVRRLSPTHFASNGIAFPVLDLVRSLQSRDAHYSDGDFMYDLTKLLREIMQEARNLTDAERCSVFLLDQDSDELVATVFDGITTNNKEVQAEIRLPKTQGIAGHVATTGTLLNIKDAYSHPLFYRGIDDSTGFRTRNILCFPIKDEEGVVLGVAQLCNKKTGTYFTTFDEDIASAFAIYCCISISHCLMYKKLQDTQHRNKLANELMMFHMQQIPSEEVHELASLEIPNIQVFHPDFDSFIYPPRSLAEMSTPRACQAMFEDLGFITRYRVKPDTLARFLLMVKKGYRNPPYHNWMHAFAVAHFGYLCIKNLKLADSLDDIEMFALFVACLCHDIDHRGTTNSFQVKSQSVLAALYSSEGSVMERHHLAQSMCILNTEGSNIFENLTSREYQQVLDLMRDIILATDVAHHLRILGSLEEMAERGYNKNDPKDHNLLLCLLMTASDLSDQTKSWKNTKHIAVLIYQEFFSQGDLEKALGESPLEMMDRERACVPDLQISFLDNIAIPVYKLLAKMMPGASSVAERVDDNRRHWVRKGQLLKIHNNSAQTMSVQEIIALGEEEEEVVEEKMDTSQQNGR